MSGTWYRGLLEMLGINIIKLKMMTLLEEASSHPSNLLVIRSQSLDWYSFDHHCVVQAPWASDLLALMWVM